MIKLIRTKAKRAFTLIELVVVIAVIAILAGVSVAAYFGVTNSARESAALQEAEQLVTLVNVVASTDGEVDINGSADGGEYKLSVTADGLTVTGPEKLTEDNVEKVFDAIYFVGSEGEDYKPEDKRFSADKPHADLTYYGEYTAADNKVVIEGLGYTLNETTAHVAISADFEYDSETPPAEVDFSASADAGE